MGRDFAGWALREWWSGGALDLAFGGAPYKTVGMVRMGWEWDSVFWKGKKKNENIGRHAVTLLLSTSAPL